MLRGKRAFLVSLAVLGLGVALLGSPAVAQLATSGSVAGEDNLAPAPAADVAAIAGLTGTSVEVTWSLSDDDYVRQASAGIDPTSGGTFINVNDVAGYRIYRQDGDADAQLLTTVDAGITEYTDAAVMTGILYTYEIVAVDAAENESEGVAATPVSLGPPASGDFDDSDIDFGEVDAADTATSTITFTNTSTDADAILGVVAAISGEGFAVDPDGLSLAQDESGTLTVTFDPVAAGEMNGAYEGELVIRTNDPERPETTIALSAEITGGLEEQEIEVSALEMDFARVELDSTSSQELVITNTGGVVLSGSVSLTGDDAFTTDAEDSFAIAGGDSVVITVTFAPTDTMAYAGTLTLVSDDADEGEIEIDLSGLGIIAGQVVSQEISLSTEAIGFDSVAVDSSASQVLTISNSGDVELTGSVALTGDAVFTIDAADSFAVAGGDSLVITVTFAPVDTMEYTATVTVVSNDADEGEIEVPLTGTGFAAVAEVILPGDFDGDNTVGFSDFFLFADHFGETSDVPGFVAAFDLDESGDVGFSDFFLFADSFGSTLVDGEIVH